MSSACGNGPIGEHALPTGYHQRRKKEHIEKGNGFGYSLFNEESPYTSTMSARYYKDGSEILVSQGKRKRPRRLTPRECARLMGFPDSFNIPVSETQAYRQFGNSVGMPVMQEVARIMTPHVVTLCKEEKGEVRQVSLFA